MNNTGFDSPSLDRVQRWFQAVIMHPEGIAAGAVSEGARSQVDATDVEQIVTPSSRLTAIERLQVYGHAYFARLLECLQDEFPAVRHAVGDDAFGGFVFGYLQKYPSQSYTLARLGARFPLYLEETRPGHEPQEDTFAQFVIDLARLERLYSEVFDGPGMEGEPTLQTDDLLAIPPDRWGDVRLVPAECLRIEEFAFSVDEYAAAVRKKEEPDIPAPAMTHLAVYRADYIVRRLPLTAAQFHLLRGLLVGETLAGAIARASERGGDAPEVLLPELRGWFTRWTALGFFRRAEL